LFGAVQAYLDQRLPPPTSRTKTTLAWALGVLFAFGAGVIVGRHTAPAAPATTAATAPPPSGNAVGGPTLAATFFRDTGFKEVAFTRRDTSVAFDWGSEPPAEGFQGDHFSARWEGRLNVGSAGNYVFYLTSDDG